MNCETERQSQRPRGRGARAGGARRHQRRRRGGGNESAPPRTSRFGFVHVGTDTCQASNSANSVASAESTGSDVALNALRQKSTCPSVAVIAKPFMSSGDVLSPIGFAKPYTCFVIELKSCGGSTGPPSIASKSVHTIFEPALVGSTGMQCGLLRPSTRGSVSARWPSMWSNAPARAGRGRGGGAAGEQWGAARANDDSASCLRGREAHGFRTSE